MNIGMIKLPDGAGLAPMAGVTDMPMRMISFRAGAAWAVTEMLSAKGFLYAPKGTRAMNQLLRHSEEEGILGLQLFGREPDYIREAANQLSGIGFGFIDLNMGCPAPKIVNNREGSALMKEPELAERIIAAAVKGTRLPVTVKFRSGWDAEHINAVDFARRAEQAGAAALTIHARTREQMYSGRADYSVIARVKAAVTIPVIGNGDVRSIDGYRKICLETGCDAVAIGRGAQGNPWIFSEILSSLRGEPFRAPTMREKILTAIKHARMQAEYVGPDQSVREMRKHIAWYTQGMPDSARLRDTINHARTAQEAEEILILYLEENDHDKPEA